MKGLITGPVALLIGSISAVLFAQAGSVEFERIGNFELVVAGAVDTEAQMYQSAVARGILVISNRLPTAVLLHPGSGGVETVPLIRLAPRPGGGIRLLRGEPLRSLGNFQVGNDGIAFRHGSISVKLRTKPPLVGESSLGELFEHSPEYKVEADAYQPDAETVARLLEVGDGYSVRVIFGSWCHVCERFLPRGLRVQEALAESRIRFEYYGLPANPWNPPHPEVSRSEVKSLPTAIVYHNGKEIGRYAGGDEWLRPEQRLWSAIRSSR